MNTIKIHYQKITNDLHPLLKLAIPLALTGLVQSSTYFFQTLFLAHLSSDSLAAGSLVSWFFGTLAVILFGTLSSINILIAHKYGADDHDGISLVVRDGLLLSIILVIPAFLLIYNMPSIFLILGQTPAITALAKSYLYALAWGLLPNFVMISLFEFIIGIGHARIIMIFTVISVSLNIFFSNALIFGKYSMPALGIAGAGWGMSISYWITAFILTVYLLTSKIYKSYFKNICKIRNPSYLLELLQIGLPMGLMFSFEVAFFFAMTLLMGSLGNHLLAANQVVMQYLGSFISVVFSIAQAITVRMGHLLGAKNIRSAKRVYYVGFIMTITFIGICSIFYGFFPDALISIDFNVHDSDNAELIHYAKQFFSIAAFFMIFESIRISLFGALRGLKDTRFPLLISIISFWGISLPIGYLLATYFHFNGAGLWWGMVIGAGFSASILYWRFKLKMRRL